MFDAFRTQDWEEVLEHVATQAGMTTRADPNLEPEIDSDSELFSADKPYILIRLES